MYQNKYVLESTQVETFLILSKAQKLRFEFLICSFECFRNLFTQQSTCLRFEFLVEKKTNLKNDAVFTHTTYIRIYSEINLPTSWPFRSLNILKIAYVITKNIAFIIVGFRLPKPVNQSKTICRLQNNERLAIYAPCNAMHHLPSYFKPLIFLDSAAL